MIAARPPRGSSGAVSVEVLDDRGTRVAGEVGGGVYAAILEQPNDHRKAFVCCKKWSLDKLTRRGISFPIYSAENRHVQIGEGFGTRDGHHDRPLPRTVPQIDAPSGRCVAAVRWHDDAR